MEKLRQQFEEETKQGRYNTEGIVPVEDNGSFNDAYVEWLEKKHIEREQPQALDMHDVMNCCDDPDNRGFKNSENGISWYCKKCFKTLYSS